MAHQCGTGKVFTASTADDALEILSRRAQILLRTSRTARLRPCGKSMTVRRIPGRKSRCCRLDRSVWNASPYIQVNSGFGQAVGPGTAKLTLTYN